MFVGVLLDDLQRKMQDQEESSWDLDTYVPEVCG